MKRKIFVFFGCAIIFLFGILAGCSNQVNPTDASALVQSLQEGVGKEWEFEALTTVTPYAYTDGEGNAIIYYLCRTAYDKTVPESTDGVHLAAVSCVVDPVKADSSCDCNINGMPAILYQKGEHSYLCWTLSPEVSCVIRYDPQAVTWEEIVKMAESVRNS